ncbi:MAG: glycosyltransferase [Acidimicrobiia bacterium]|nr:glycosyltransferase [Acidimicrobiia bacterium]
MIARVAYLSMHTSPLLQPGTGDAGGLNVYVDELARTMAKRGVEVVIYTRRNEPDQPDEVAVAPGYVVRHITAGPIEHLPVGELARWIALFTEGVIEDIRRGPKPDVVHSHYWLSGWSGVLVKEALDIPLANSFHTLGRIKDLSRRSDERASSPMRTMTEEEVIARSNCVIASTPFEFDDLLDHYGASPERLCTSPPGIDHSIFQPGDKQRARSWLGLPDVPTILFAGRIQALKGLDIAISAMAHMHTPAHLVIVGGPSGVAGEAEIAHLRALADGLNVRERIHLIEPQPHDQLARFYQAADVLIMPSRSETFGLVAAEAQACGLPVVASRIGGIPYVVADRESGLLVEVGDEPGFAHALDRILSDESFHAELSKGALLKSAEFSWKATADRLLELYHGISGKEPAHP